MTSAHRLLFRSRTANIFTSAVLLALAVAGTGLLARPALALSELKPGETAPVTPPAGEPSGTTAPQTPAAPGPIEVPAPDPIAPPADPEDEAAPADEQPAQPDVQIDEGKANIARPNIEPGDGPAPEIQYDLTKLPEPVQRMRQLLVDAAISGEIENLRPLIGTGPNAPLLSLSEATDSDPVGYLKNQAGDEAGREILAILEEVLNAGYVHLNAGKPEEIYVWPYFFGIAMDKLTPRQTVELFKIITGGEYEEMRQVGAYVFFRVGITPAGEWAFFVSGE